ncbi:MAG: AAA family ATPase [Clostridia bacterium]|nr:AAA family ATPase [Clostridia bacterium]
MKKVLIVNFSGNWVLNRIADPERPNKVVEGFLTATYGDKVSVQKASFIEVKAEFDDAQILEAEIVEKTQAFIRDKYELAANTDVFSVVVEAVVEKTEEKTESEGEKSEEKPTEAKPVIPKLSTEAPKVEEKDQLAEVMKAIDAVIGGDEFKAIAKEIAAIAPGVIESKTEEVFTYQSYLFSINDGYGLSEYLNLLAKLISATKIHTLNAVNPYEVVTLRLDEKDPSNTPVAQAKEYLKKGGSNFIKILCFDISEWMNKLDSKDFKEFLALVETYLKSFVVVFRIPFVDKEVLEQVRYSLNDIMYVRSVAIPPYSNEELQKCAQSQLDNYGFKMSKNAWGFFHQRLSEERSDGKFYGLNTVKKVVRELLYKKQLSNAIRHKKDMLITCKDAKEICMNANMAGVSGYDLLAKMVGGEVIRQRLDEIITQIELARQDPTLGIPCIHMRFVGNPGTGKTTVARIVGKILKERGILRIGNFYECSGRDLCGRYVGETAPKTASLCRDAYGSVLFIDEAYSLYRGGSSNDYGKEALDTLIAEMENHRSDLVVIMAGYTEDMEILMKGNAGLASRMPYVLEFPNFNREELFTIFKSMVSGRFKYDEELLVAAKEYFNALPDAFITAKEFSNGRFVRNLFERTWAKAAMRCQLAKTSGVVLTKDDFTRASSDAEFKMNTANKKRSIGFIDTY